MLCVFQALLRNLASFGGLLLALVCLVWLTLLREKEPEGRVGWESSMWHEEGSVPQERVPSKTEEPPPDAKVEPVLVQQKDKPVTPADEPVAPRKRPLVVVDAGHGGGDGGAVWNGIIEKNLALTLALKVKAHLEKLGVDVLMTRPKDSFVTLENRAAMANKALADLFVSVHLNSSGTEAGVRGIETYYCTSKSLSAVRLLQSSFKLASTVGMRDRRGEKLAAAVQRMVCQETGAVDRGIKERAYTVVHGVSCPAVLVECGFISNAKEAAQLKTKAYQEKLAAGVARGIASFLQGQMKDPARGIEMQRTAQEGPVSKPELISQK